MSGGEWPTLADDAFYGLAGEVAAGAAPYTEADPAAVLVTFLATAGCYLVSGRSHAGFPHVWIGDTEHPPRIWPVLAGATADGRKGTADAIVRRILAAADLGFLNGNVESGLTSGSGLIERVRDPSGDDVPAKLQHPGVTDKRLLVVEHEFGGTLRRASRDGNDLSERMREAWDGRPLSTMSRSANRMRATGAPHHRHRAHHPGRAARSLRRVNRRGGRYREPAAAVPGAPVQAAARWWRRTGQRG
jgi:hypothetical protein